MASRADQEAGSATEITKQVNSWPAMLKGLGLAVGVAGLAFFLSGWLPRFVLWGGYVAVLIAIGYKDFRERRIPNRLVYPAILVALGAMFHFPGWQSALLGGAVAALFLALPVVILGPSRAGVGDVKLALFVGLILGYSYALYGAMFIAFGGAALVGLVGIALRMLTRRSLLPFGVFLAIGTIIMLVLQMI